MIRVALRQEIPYPAPGKINKAKRVETFLDCKLPTSEPTLRPEAHHV